MKKIFIVIVCMILLLCIAGGVGYYFFFNHIDADTKAEVDKEIEIINDRVATIIDEEKAVIDIAINKPEEDEDMTGEKKDLTNPALSEEVSSVIQTGTEQLTVDTVKIIEAYYKGMKALEEEGNAIVSQLLSNAKADYAKLKEENGTKKDLIALASAYSNQAKAMESGMDTSVDRLLNELEKELKACGLEGKDSSDIINQLRDEYKVKKNQRYNEVLEKYQKLIDE